MEMDIYAQKSEKEKEEKSLPHPKKCKKKVKVVKSREYKIQHLKKEPSSGNDPYAQKSSVLIKSSMITLQDITSKGFYVVLESVARLSGVWNPLKSISSAMEK